LIKVEPTKQAATGWYAPLLHYSSRPDVFFCEPVSEEVRSTMRQIGLRNLAVEKELSGILTALEALPVPVILLKGSHLIQEIYPWGIRPVGDIDLLIRQEDFASAHKAITSLGYQPWLKTFPLWIHLHYSGKVTYTRPAETGTPISLDLHLTLGPRPYLGYVDPAALWSKAVETRVNGRRVYVLCPEHLLIHLCLHLLQHTPDHWAVCGCDIAALLRHEENRFPWESFLEETTAAGVNRPVRYALETVNKMFDALIPAAILDRLSKPPSGRPGWKLRLYFFCQRSETRKYLLQFISTPGWREKLGCFPYILPFLLRRFKNN